MCNLTSNEHCVSIIKLLHYIFRVYTVAQQDALHGFIYLHSSAAHICIYIQSVYVWNHACIPCIMFSSFLMQEVVEQERMDV